MKHILVPTDFSENAHNALLYALQLAKVIEAKVTLLHVVEVELNVLDVPLPSGSALQARRDAARLTMGAQAARALADLNMESEIDQVLISGNPVASIIEHSLTGSPDLIVMAARGKWKSGIQKTLGTRSTSIAQQTLIPALIIPPGVSFKPYVQLAFATDLQPSDPYILWQVLELIKPLNPVVRYIHISNKSDLRDQSRLEKMRKYLESTQLGIQSVFYQIYGEDVDKELEEFSRNFEIDLFVLHHQSRNVFDRFMGRSHTKHLLSMLELPVVVFRE